MTEQEQKIFDLGYSQGIHDATKWTSIKKDGLPKKAGDYIVAFRHQYQDGEISYRLDRLYFRGKKHWAVCDEDVSHWMAMPEAPQDE